MTEPAIEISNVSKTFRLYAERNQSLKAAVLRGRRSKFEDFVALNDISFDVPTGSMFGITGNNGSGKSTLLKCVARILVPNTGSITTRGTVASLLELGSGFHPELSGRENVFLNASVMRIPRSYMEEQYEALVDFSGIREFIDQPVKTYSSGMYMRLAFSVAAHIDPDILLVDEVIAVGDADFQAKCAQKFDDMRKNGRTVVIASGALGRLETMCDEVARLDHGNLVGLHHPVQRTSVAAADIDLKEDSDTPPILSGLDVLGPEGFATDGVSSGDTVTFRLHYDTEIPIEAPVFAIELRTISAARAWSQHSRGSALVPHVLVGKGSIDVQVPRLALQNGSYEVHTAVLDDTITHTLDSKNHGFVLKVTNDSLTEREGLAVLGGQWGNPVQDENLTTGGRESHGG